MRPLSEQQGFTLIEVLLAVSITVVVAAMSYQGLDAAMKLAQRSEAEADRIQQLNRVFYIFAKDFLHVVPRKVRSAYTDGYEDAFFYQPLSVPMLGFTRTGWTNPLAERFQRSQLQRVNYHYDGESLIRYSWQMLDRYDDSKVTEITLLTNIDSFQINLLYNSRLINNNGNNANAARKKKSQWTDKWPITQDENRASEQIPMAIELKLEIQGWGEVRRLFEIVDGELES